MRIVSRPPLIDFGRRHAAAVDPIGVWYRTVKSADWRTPADVRAVYGRNVDFPTGDRAIFDLGGNKYRLVAVVNFRRGIVFIRFIGTHAEYDRIDARTV